MGIKIGQGSGGEYVIRCVTHEPAPLLNASIRESATRLKDLTLATHASQSPLKRGAPKGIAHLEHTLTRPNPWPIFIPMGGLLSST